MAAFSSIALGIGAAGLGVSAYGTARQAKAQKKATQASLRAEALREQQMNLEFRNKQREQIRKAQNLRALGLARTTNQGVSQDSSALGGVFGEIQGALGRNLSFNREALAIGAGIFDANADIARAQGQANTFGGVASFGTNLLQSSQQIGRIGSTVFGNSNSTNTSGSTNSGFLYSPPLPHD